jgi:uncharacterized protein (DUF1800 family)
MAVSRRTFVKGTAAVLAAVGLPAWAIRELHTHGELSPLARHIFQPAAAADDAGVHLLNRITFGATAAEVERVRRIGVEAYLQEQLYPERIDEGVLDARLAGFRTLAMDGASLLRQQPQQVQQELMQATVLRALYSRRQLQEVLVDFWSNHFNVFIGKQQCRFFKTLDDRDAIRPHVLGRFRDLLGASAKSPAMLVFLDNRLNRKQAPNENYARELMELHTLSVDGGYTEQDVQAVARCFTGWTIKDGAFYFEPRQHDTTAKTVLGTEIPAGGGIEDGERVLDLLAHHPRTAHFVAFKLCRRFVADVPPPALVERVAGVFQATDGDLRAVVAAIVHAPDFAASGGQKFRRPVDWVFAVARATGAETDGKALAQQLRSLAQPIFGEAAPAGYPDVGSAWTTTSGLLGRWNFALTLARGQIKDVKVDLVKLTGDAHDAQTAAERIVAALLPGQPAAELATYLAKFLGGAQATSQQIKQRTPVAVGLLLAAPVSQFG